MAENKQAIKARIKSINTTMKITSAMKLIANAKLARQRRLMEQNREYSHTLKNTVSEILADASNSDNRYLKSKSSDSAITIIFCSDIGLCGGYNVNMMKLALLELDPNDPIIVIGNKSRAYLETRGFKIVNEPVSSDSISFLEIKNLVDQAINYYDLDEVSKIQVIYTEFMNTVSFEPRLVQLLPYVKEERQDLAHSYQETIFEPNSDEVLNHLIPMMLENVTYAYWMETKTSEQGTRRLAMENATDNAKELNEELLLRYNKARQTAITQEITEIVAGADAI